MKKLMCAVAAIAAGVAFADSGIASANVVGYADNEFADGAKMMSMNFRAVAHDGIKVSELKPVGYLDNATYMTKRKAGVQGTIYFEILGDNGDTMNITKDVGEAEPTDEYPLKWAWYHTWSNSSKTWQDDARWLDAYGDTQVGDPSAAYDADYTIPTGTAIWISVDGYQEGMKFTVNGQALLDAAEVEFNDGAKPMAIPLSCDLAIWNATKGCNNIYPTNYLDNATYMTKRKAGIQGTIYFEILGDNGDTMNITKDVGEAEPTDEYPLKWAWYHTWSNSSKTWQDDARWLDAYGDTEVGDPDAAYDANYTIPMGTAIWVSVDGFQEGMTMAFPGVDDL